MIPTLIPAKMGRAARLQTQGNGISCAD